MGPEEPFFELEVESWGVLARRTERSYDSDAEVHASFDRLMAAAAPRPPAECGLFVDLTAVRGRNDNRFEAVIVPRVHEVYAAYARSGVLVRTQVGQMQLRRHLSGIPRPIEVFLDRHRALVFARGRHAPA